MSTVLTDAIQIALRVPCVARRRATPLRIADRAAGPHSVAVPEPEPQTPFALVGGADRVRALVESFYDIMSDREPALSRLHRCTPEGRVDRYSRDRFALFLIGWLGGPQDYIAQYGHPRLRMRHARVPVDVAMRDAWLRSMRMALDEVGVDPELRAYLETRLAEVADFLRNRPG